MQLKSYLQNTRFPKETLAQRCERFGAQLGVSGAAVHKWIYRQRRIKDHIKLRIVRLTHGQVSAADLIVR
jgi:DNA-binding transcriptional regulator YdaS (Cro superfamily)